jgi:hypothetical protein
MHRTPAIDDFLSLGRDDKSIVIGAKGFDGRRVSSVRGYTSSVGRIGPGVPSQKPAQCRRGLPRTHPMGTSPTSLRRSANF